MYDHSIISLENVSKTFYSFQREAGFLGSFKDFFSRKTKAFSAIDKISFRINQGEFVGLLGPNGAGKTTTLKILTGLIEQSSGSIRVFKKFEPIRRQPGFLKKIGLAMGQRNQLNPDLPAIDSFRLTKEIYGLSNESFNKSLKYYSEFLDIAHKLKTPVRKLSLGERMKLELILSILHDPEILFLDEPTIGLDFEAAKKIRAFLKEKNKKDKTTVILTSHYTKDVEELCERVILIHKGTVKYDGPRLELNKILPEKKIIKIFLKASLSIPAILDKLQNLSKTAGAEMSVQENMLQLKCGKQISISLLNKALNTISHEDILDIVLEEQSLEDVFSYLYASGEERTQ